MNAAAGGPAAQAVTASPRSVAHGWLIALLGWTILVCFYRLDDGARFEPIDCWVAQTAREMYERPFPGNLLVPRFAGETRMQKSPGPYWAVMLTAWLRGQSDIDEVSARIPSAVAAVLLVITIWWLTRQIATERAAVFAGFAAASSTLVLWWSHRAASDLGLTVCTTVSLATLWVACECEPPGPRRRALLLLGYFAAGVGMLYKMPMPLAIVGVPAVLYLLLWRRWRILWDRWHLLGVVLFLLPWLPWALTVMSVEEAAWAKWKVEFLDRFTGALPNVEGQGGWKNIGFYLPVPLLYCLPFTLSLPAAIARALCPPQPVNRRGTLFMLAWVAGLLVFFTASTGKEYRYFLPALPPLFVLLGIELARFFDPRRAPAPRRDWIGAIAVWLVVPGALLIGGGFGLHYWWRKRGQAELEGLHAWGDVWAAFVITAVVLSVGCALAAWLYRRRQEQVSFGVVVAAMWAAWLYAWPNLAPYIMSQRPFTDFAEQLVRRVPAEARRHIRMAGSQDPRIIWYSDVRYPRVIDQLELLSEQRQRWRSGRQSHLRDLDYEISRYGQRMVELLADDELNLFVITFESYLFFMTEVPRRLAAEGRTMPPVHLWLQTRYGNFDRHFILFGNRPPPFRPPELRVPEKLRNRLIAEGWEWTPVGPTTRATVASGPSTRPADAPLMSTP